MGNWHEHISIDPLVRSGKPCIKGTRITVGDVLAYLAAGTAMEVFLEEFPAVSKDDILACLAFAAERERSLHIVTAA